MSIINREDAINYLMTNMNWHDEDGYAVEDADEKRAIITDLINGVPDAEDGWIPCEKRLPEDEYVLISKKPTKILGSKWNVAIAIRTADPRSRKIQWRDSGFGVIQDDKVLAWMPLPKPYQPKEDKWQKRANHAITGFRKQIN